MNRSSEVINKNLQKILQGMATKGIEHAVEGLSAMVGEPLTASTPSVRLVPILEIPQQLGGPEDEVIGIYLKAEGEMAGQFMLIMPYDKAFELIDMLMGEVAGTTLELEGIGRSALAEVGNLTGTFFLNAIAEMTGRSTKPTPPAVMFDMVGAILNVVVATSAEAVDNVITISTNIMHGERRVETTFWYIPDSTVMEHLSKDS